MATRQGRDAPTDGGLPPPRGRLCCRPCLQCCCGVIGWFVSCLFDMNSRLNRFCCCPCRLCCGMHRIDLVQHPEGTTFDELVRAMRQPEDPKLPSNSPGLALRERLLPSNSPGLALRERLQAKVRLLRSTMPSCCRRHHRRRRRRHRRRRRRLCRCMLRGDWPRRRSLSGDTGYSCGFTPACHGRPDGGLQRCQARAGRGDRPR